MCLSLVRLYNMVHSLLLIISKIMNRDILYSILFEQQKDFEEERPTIPREMAEKAIKLRLQKILKENSNSVEKKNYLNFYQQLSV